jgi:hypothetical protein
LISFILNLSFTLVAQPDSTKSYSINIFLGSAENKYDDAALICTYSGNIDSLIHQTSLAHKANFGILKTNDSLTLYSWAGLSNPFWFYTDYAVNFEVYKKENSQFDIRIYHEYSDPKFKDNISSTLLINMGGTVKTFYEDIFRKALEQ